MLILDLPNELIDIILNNSIDLILNEKLDKENISKNILTLSMTNKCFLDILKERKQEIQEKYNQKSREWLIDKYSHYRSRYDSWLQSGDDPKGTPELLDALFTSCYLPFSTSSYNILTKEIKDDICAIIKLIPESIYCQIGLLQFKNYVTPLFVACVNECIPIDIIKLLLENNATKYMTNDNKKGFLFDLLARIRESRYSIIEKLLKNY